MNPLDDDTSTRTGLWVVFSTVTILLISVIIWVLKGADGANDVAAPAAPATTPRAPRRNNTSVNPPVDAPASSTFFPTTLKPAGSNASNAPNNLCAPRDAQSSTAPPNT